MARNFTLSEVHSVLSLIVNKTPDFTYDTLGCHYADFPEHDLVPIGSCIIGALLDYLGLLGLVPPARNDVSCISIFPILEEAGITFDADARVLMTYVQGHQDGGMAWGLALSKATDEVREEALAEFKATNPVFGL